MLLALIEAPTVDNFGSRLLKKGDKLTGPKGPST